MRHCSCDTLERSSDFLEPKPLRRTTCVLIALAAAILGAGLRLALPVTPVDEEFRDVIRFYKSLERS